MRNLLWQAEQQQQQHRWWALKTWQPTAVLMTVVTLLVRLGPAIAGAASVWHGSQPSAQHPLLCRLPFPIQRAPLPMPAWVLLLPSQVPLSSPMPALRPLLY